MGRGFSNRLRQSNHGRLAWHPIEDMLAVGAIRGTWLFTSDLDDSNLLQQGNASISWSPDGRFLANWALGLQVWDTESQQSIVLDDQNVIKTVAWSPDSTLLAYRGTNIDSYRTIEIWDVLQDTMVTRLDEYEDMLITSLDWHPNGQFLAGSDWYGEIVIWDVATGQIIANIEAYEDHANVVMWHPSGEFLASMSEEGMLILWSVNEGEVEMIATHTPFDSTNTIPKARIEWSPDGNVLALTRGNILQFANIADLLSGVDNFTVYERDFAILEMDWKTDADLLATIDIGGYLSILDFERDTQQINLINSTSGGHIDSINSISLSPNGEMVISGSSDGTVRIWEISSGNSVAVIYGVGRSVAWSPSGLYVAYIHGNPSIVSIVDVANWQAILELDDATDLLASVTWSPAGNIIASGSWDGILRLWDVTSNEFLLEIEISTESINSVAWSPDDTRLSIGGDSGILAILDLSSTYEAVTYNYLYNLDFIIDITTHSLAWSPDGNILASGDGSGTIYLWDTNTFEEISTIDAHRGNVTSLDFDATGTTLVSTSPFNEYAYIWDVNTGETIARIPNAVRINDVRWLEDSTSIISGNLDGTISVWEIISPTD